MTVASNVKDDCDHLIENSHTWKQKHHHRIQIIDKLQTLSVIVTHISTADL